MWYSTFGPFLLPRTGSSKGFVDFRQTITSVRSSERRDSRNTSPHSRPPSASASLLNLQRQVDTVTVRTTLKR